MTKDEALKLALEGLEKWAWGKDPRGADGYIIAIREALASPVATIDTLQERVDETSKQRHEAQHEQEPKKIPESWATHGGLWIEALYKHQRGD